MKEKELLIEILNNIHSAVIVCDSSGNFTLWNKEAERLINVNDGIAPIDEWTEFYGVYQVDRKTKYKNEDLPIIRALGGERVKDELLFIINKSFKQGRFLTVDAFPVYSGAVAIFTDITDSVLMKEMIHDFAVSIGTMKTMLENEIFYKIKK